MFVSSILAASEFEVVLLVKYALGLAALRPLTVAFARIFGNEIVFIAVECNPIHHAVRPVKLSTLLSLGFPAPAFDGCLARSTLMVS